MTILNRLTFLKSYKIIKKFYGRFSMDMARSSGGSCSLIKGRPRPCKYPVKKPEVFDLEELDSYSGHVQVKKESSKPSSVSKPTTSSKATAMPKPSPATKPRATSSRKRKETDSPATHEAFPYENQGFLESSALMTSSLNQGLGRLTHLYEDACGVNRMLEAKLKEAQVTIKNHEKIAAAKSQHYEDKYKAMTQETQTAIQKANQDAQAKVDAAQLQHEQDMNSYREGLKGSVVISLLQARLKMAYEARAAGFECPSWNIGAWEAKLKDLGGKPVEYPAKPVVAESSKAVEVAVEAPKDPEADAGAGGEDVVDDAVEVEKVGEDAVV